jgi:hypothetical protein
VPSTLLLHDILACERVSQTPLACLSTPNSEAIDTSVLGETLFGQGFGQGQGKKVWNFGRQTPSVQSINYVWSRRGFVCGDDTEGFDKFDVPPKYYTDTITNTGISFTVPAPGLEWAPGPQFGPSTLPYSCYQSSMGQPGRRRLATHKLVDGFTRAYYGIRPTDSGDYWCCVNCADSTFTSEDNYRASVCDAKLVNGTFDRFPGMCSGPANATFKVLGSDVNVTQMTLAYKYVVVDNLAAPLRCEPVGDACLEETNKDVCPRNSASCTSLMVTQSKVKLHGGRRCTNS